MNWWGRAVLGLTIACGAAASAIAQTKPAVDVCGIVTSAKAGGPIMSAEVPPAEPVKDNLVSFARAVRGVERYPITADQLVNNIGLLGAIFASTRSGKIETVA